MRGTSRLKGSRRHLMQLQRSYRPSYWFRKGERDCACTREEPTPSRTSRRIKHRTITGISLCEDCIRPLEECQGAVRSHTCRYSMLAAEFASDCGRGRYAQLDRFLRCSFE